MKNAFYYIFFSSILLTSSIISARYKSKPLKKILKDQPCQQKDISKEEYISFDYQIFKAKDCKKYFNSKNLIKDGYQPIQITFTNNSQHPIAISKEGFNFTVIKSQDVATASHRDGAARGAGFGIGALFCPVLLIPACVQGFGAETFNDKMDNNFVNKELKDQIVPPFQSVNGIVFVDVNNFSQDFTFSVKNNNQKLILSTQEPKLNIEKLQCKE